MQSEIIICTIEKINFMKTHFILVDYSVATVFFVSIYRNDLMVINNSFSHRK